MSETKDISLSGDASSGKAINYTLWALQGLLALLFLFAGVTKLIMKMEPVAQQMHMPVLFLRFIGVAETLGGLGLILPWLLRIRQGLTPLAAALLVIIMIGAVVVTLQTGTAVQAIFPLVSGILLAFVAYGRWKLAPQR
ncbi:MAG: DoxX family protein [Acidobacteriia bacterium]|nr:DoxX family protein [Terriglobia bacterium]